MDHNPTHCPACFAAIDKLEAAEEIRSAALSLLRWLIPITITGTGVIVVLFK